MLTEMSESGARRITGRIRTVAGMVAESMEKLVGLIREAEAGQAHIVLGYRSWTEYVEQEFTGLLLKLPQDVRREFVREIAQTGLPTRAIAAVVDVSHMTVARDLAAVTNVTTADGEIVDAEIVEVGVDRFFADATERDETFAMTDGVSDEQFEMALANARADDDLSRANVVRKVREIVDPQPAPRQITGRDGKTYTAPAPRARRRRPLPDAFSTAVYDLRKRVNTLTNLVVDDRFNANKEHVATRHRGELIRARDALDQILEQLG